MKKSILSSFIAVILLCSCGVDSKSKNKKKLNKPNIVIIYADDLGYGDVSCYNANGKITTPNIDKLADNGMMFTDAHSPDGICSPSRYGILTGSYS